MTRLRWGLIGAGDIAKKRVAPALRELSNCELVSVSRSRAELAESFAREFAARKWFAEWQELIEDDEIDAVYIATPVHLHAEQSVAAARAGKHVLCEKPMAMSVKESSDMIAACSANDVKLGLAYYRRFYPSIVRTKEIIASGEIGKVSVAQINSFENFDPPSDHSRAWLLDKAKSGGGPMMDFGCHRVEVLMNLFGRIQEIDGITSDMAFERNVEDTAVALFRFEVGCCATITTTHAAIEPRDTVDIYGTKGSIHVPALNKGDMTIVVGGKTRAEFHPPAANVHQPLIQDFTEAVLQDREPSIDGETGKQVNLAVEQIYKTGIRPSANK